MRAPRGLLVLSLVLAPLAGCLDLPDAGDAGADGPTRLSTEAWKALLSEPVYDGIVSSVAYLAAADGTQLALSLHLPEGLEDGAKIPTLLEITPYQPLEMRRSTPVSGTDGVGSLWGDFVVRGAAYVQADARGTGASEGCLDFGGTADREDARAFAAWIREQPWSNGVIVTDGVSHPGMGSVVAHAAIPDLGGALAHAPVVSYYQDEWLQGAKFENQFNGPLYEAIEVAPSPWVSPEALKAQAATCRGKTTLDFTPIEGPFTALWDDRHLGRHTEAQRAPILLTHGFVDENVHPDHSQMYWDALPDDYPKRMILGWWYHGFPDMDGHPAGEFDDVRHRWFDALLFGKENGLFADPRVLVEDSTGVWHEGNAWPLEPSETVTLAATADGGLASEAGPAGEAAYPDPLDPPMRGVWDGVHVAFRSEPLASPRLVNGAPVVDLVATSTEEATKWVVYLLDEAPDGSWQRVSHGYADSHTWGDEAEWSPIVPGTAYSWRVRLMPTAVVLEAGHRLTLLVTSQDSAEVASLREAPCFDDYRGGCYTPSGILPAESAGRAVNTVLVGDGGTRVTFEWVDPALTAKPPA